jgi:hypothetical protein
MDVLKSEMINWILSLKDESLTLATWEWMKTHLPKDTYSSGKEPNLIRQPGFGKHFFKSIAPDFNEPLDDFKEYML